MAASVSGVSLRTRLQELQALERRVNQEIAYARRRADGRELNRLLPLRDKVEAAIREAGGTPTPRPHGQPKTRRKKAEDRVTRHLERLGVTAHDVKVWAVDAGLLDQVRRGRIKGDLVDAYERAHTTPDIARSA